MASGRESHPPLYGDFGDMDDATLADILNGYRDDSGPTYDATYGLQHQTYETPHTHPNGFPTLQSAYTHTGTPVHTTGVQSAASAQTPSAASPGPSASHYHPPYSNLSSAAPRMFVSSRKRAYRTPTADTEEGRSKRQLSGSAVPRASNPYGAFGSYNNPSQRSAGQGYNSPSLTRTSQQGSASSLERLGRGQQNGGGTESQLPRTAFQQYPALSPMMASSPVQGQFPLAYRQVPQDTSNNGPHPSNVIDLTKEEDTAAQEPIFEPFPELREAYPDVNGLFSFSDGAWGHIPPGYSNTPGASVRDHGYGYHPNKSAPIELRDSPFEQGLSGSGANWDVEEPSPGDSEAITKLIESIQPEMEVAPEDRERKPKQMASDLFEHQKLGLAWLKKAEEDSSRKGAILADEMGLGKTVEAIALILARPSPSSIIKTTLVVAPIALMRQWEKELRHHVLPEHSLQVHVYHGSGTNVDFHKLRKCDVVLTTFGTLAMEFKKFEKRLEEGMRDPNHGLAAKDKLALIGPECEWYRVILDEAQNIKNKSTRSARAAWALRSKYRLCMTGTPMMNSVDELYSLIRFLRIRPYDDFNLFNTQIGKAMRNENQRERAFQRVQALLKRIMLRRQKTTVLDGKPIVNIPDKVIRFHHVDFSSHERQLYDAIFQNGQVEFNKYLKKGTVNNHYVAILARILRLRQVCDHPHMIHDLSVQAATEGIAENDLLSRAKELTEEVVSRLREIDSFECPICLETAPNPTIFLPCGHNCCGECFQRLVDPTQIMQADEGGRPKCHSCRATLSSERITDYKHFCRVFCPENWSDEEYKGLRMDETKSDESDEDDDDVGDDDNDLGDFVVPDDVEDDYEPPRASGARPGGDSNSKGKRKGPAKPKLTLQELRKESRRNKAAKERYLRRLQKTFETSAKTDKILELLDEITATDPTEKILVFSQFTSFLDLVEVPLRQRQYKYQRYDGGMKMDERAEAVTRFMDDPTERVLLISLKAGNAGLNLSNASQVILLDPFWNPFIEDQAVDRAHRMPQKRVVHVHRVLVNDTIEDRIIELQNQKRDVIETALDETAGRNLSRLGIDDLKYLFGLGGQSRARQY